MNFSDETVDKVAMVLHKMQYYGGWEHLETELKNALIVEAKAALSSLTLADLMQVEEVRALLDAGREAEGALAAADAMLPYGGQLLSMAHSQIDKARPKLEKALKPFMAPKQ